MIEHIHATNPIDWSTVEHSVLLAGCLGSVHPRWTTNILAEFRRKYGGPTNITFFDATEAPRAPASTRWQLDVAARVDWVGVYIPSHVQHAGSLLYFEVGMLAALSKSNLSVVSPSGWPGRDFCSMFGLTYYDSTVEFTDALVLWAEGLPTRTPLAKTGPIRFSPSTLVVCHSPTHPQLRGEVLRVESSRWSDFEPALVHICSARDGTHPAIHGEHLTLAPPGARPGDRVNG